MARIKGITGIEDAIMSMLSSFQGWRIARTVRRRNYYADFFHKSITLLRHHNVVYIESSKVGCTKIKICLLEIERWPKRWDEVIEKEEQVHDKRCTGMLGPGDLPKSVLAHILRHPSYFRFGFVRNPYDRLLSAYKDKIFAPQKSSTNRAYMPIACKIKAAVTGGDHHKIDLGKTPVTFPEFVSYVVKQRSYDMDRHWYHQHLTLWHPFCKFDFIGRFERFQDDLRDVLTKIGAPERILSSVAERVNASFHTPEKFYDWRLADLVYRKFRRDFKLYAYDPKSWTDY